VNHWYKGPIAGSRVRQQLLQGGVSSVALKFLSLAANLTVTVLLARLLAPAGYGVYTLCLAIISLIAVPIQLGLPTLVLREATIYIEQQNWGLLRGLIRWAHTIILSMSLAIGCIAVGIAWLSRAKMGPGFFSTLLLAAPLLLIGSLTSVRNSALMGNKRVILAQLPELLCLPVLYLACLCGYWIFQPRPLAPQSAMGAYVACYGIAFVIGSLLLARVLPAGVRSVEPSMTPKSWARSILPLSLVSGFSVISAQLIIPIVGFFAGEESVGLYRVAASGAALATVVGATIGALVSPYIATYYGQRDYGKLQVLASYSAWACLIPALLALAIFWVAGETLLRHTFGVQFIGAAGALVILTIGQVVNCGTGIVHSLLTMTGHERETLRGAVVGAVTNVALALMLVPRFGLMGAAVSTCVAVAVENILLYITVHSRLHIGSSVFSIG
jgi:O-antigen/teichoic acid export membrane protein